MSKLKLSADSGGGTVALVGPASTTSNANVELKLPVADGSNGQALTTNASGQLAFSTVSGAALTGSTNNTITTVTGANAIQGEANLTFDGTALNVTGNSNIINSGGNAKLTLRRSNTASNTDDYGTIRFQSSAEDNNVVIGAARQSAENDGYLFISTSSSGTTSERLRITSGGDVSILNDSGKFTCGTGNDLQIYHDGSSSYLKDSSSLQIHTTDFYLNNAANTERLIKATQNAAAELYYDGSKHFETYSNGVTVTGNLSSNYNGSSQYGLTPNDSQTSGTHIQFQRQGYNNGNITHDTNNSAYNTSGSDRTLKKNFEDWTDSYWTAFKNIKPQKFHFLTDEDSDLKCRGYIAQDLVATFPEAYPKEVVSDKYMFNPSGMVPYLMKTLQEAIIKIETLEAKVAELEAA